MTETTPYIIPRVPSHLDEHIVLPTSKSISARALIINALAGDDAQIDGLSDCDDTRVMRRALAERPEVVDIMAAGTAMRFLTALFSVTPGQRILTGTERMKQRPISILVDALRSLGAEIEYTDCEGFPPLRIQGRPLAGGNVVLPANVSSQYISALLMTGPVLAEGLKLRLKGEILSRPYINMTLALMRRFGAEADWLGAEEIIVRPVPYRAEGTFRIEPDWSAASYWYEMIALCPDKKARIFLPGLSHADQSVQGDSRVAALFAPLGVRTDFAPDGVILRKYAAETIKEPYDIDFSDTPDLAQTFVVTCAMMRRPFRFTGLQSLRIKETDRISALVCELEKLGITLEAGEASVSYDGAPPRPIDPKQVAIDTYQDHRMAMSFAPCTYLYPGIRINNPEVVSKSYPNFWSDMKSC